MLSTVESPSPPDAAAQAEFREFLVEPLARAETLLYERTGLTVSRR